MDDGTWYVRVRGKTAGPYSLDQLKLLRKQKKLSRAHEISEDGQTWQSAGKLSELFPEVIKPIVSSPQLEIEPESEYEVEPASEYEIDMTGALELEAAAPLSQAPEVQWYYANQGQQLGPFSQANLTGLIAAGQILLETPVWREGMQEWVPAQTVPGLFAAAPGPMPAQPQFQQPNTGSSNFSNFSIAETRQTPMAHSAGSSTGLIAAGYMCAGLSLLILPPAFGLAGFIIGILNLVKGSTAHGIIQIILSITCGLFGMLIGMAMWS